MTYQQINTLVAGIGIPYAYYSFEEGTAEEPPFLCFYYTENNDLAADNTNYQKIEHLIIELYTDTKDFALEKTVETALNAAGLVYTRDETYLSSERMFMEVFEADVCITEET
jgi:hypothetical protein